MFCPTIPKKTQLPFCMALKYQKNFVQSMVPRYKPRYKTKIHVKIYTLTTEEYTPNQNKMKRMVPQQHK